MEIAAKRRRVSASPQRAGGADVAALTAAALAAAPAQAPLRRSMPSPLFADAISAAFDAAAERGGVAGGGLHRLLREERFAGVGQLLRAAAARGLCWSVGDPLSLCVAVLLRQAGAPVLSAAAFSAMCCPTAAAADAASAVVAVAAAAASGACAGAAHRRCVQSRVAAVSAAATGALAAATCGGVEVMWPPLAVAAQQGRVSRVKRRLEERAAIDEQMRDGKTALHVAAVFGRAEVVRLLLQAGADPTLRDAKGRTPAVFATNYGQRATAAMLREAEERRRGGAGQREYD
eukprot:TRINITY_DN40397_c0_g1_i1.p2 TRINITY_DN40397_c0_g1~~TRINITY_DN40397_c0_g1_i1.p2  ORF type:complete len:305 (+),score=146.02 TRINITY_DN40397_c0_g1_i1:47-916(+)